MTTNGPDKNGPRLLKTIGLTCETLRMLKEEEHAGVTELSKRLDLSKGAVYNHLATLRKHGLVAKKGEQYQLGLRFMNFGEFVKHQSIIFQEGRGESEELAGDTGEYVHLMEVQEKEGFFVYRARGENAVGDEYYSRNQERADPLYYTATGKAALAFMDDEEIKSIIDERALKPQTEHTVTDRDELRAELLEIRERGFALNDEEQFLGLRAVSAPIRDDENDVIGAISISGPVSRITDDLLETELSKKVVEASNIIELNIKQTRALSE